MHRDMPYPWLAAKENAYNDVSHDIVLHHGVSAFANRARAKPVAMKLQDMTPVGYTVRWVCWCADKTAACKAPKAQCVFGKCSTQQGVDRAMLDALHTQVGSCSGRCLWVRVCRAGTRCQASF
jgi:hypothetical protein